ncbi:MAG: hypothetical protein J5J06_16100 [Phycisphaerae bacterium]|nr:hypothetical protein [Phycisphaerae bacterium]
MARRQKRLQQRRRARPKRRKTHPVRALGSSLAVATVAGLLGWVWWAGETPQHPLPDPPSWLPKCPVGGGPVNFAHRVSAPDGPIYFCCEHCMEQFHAAPSTFNAKIELQRKELDHLPRIQVSCPISGDPPDPAIYVESPAGRIFFCSPNCRDKYVASPAEYAGAVASSFWYQTKCPVDEKQIDPTIRATLPSGETVYVCSQRCHDELMQNTVEYAPGLALQGIRLHLD